MANTLEVREQDARSLFACSRATTPLGGTTRPAPLTTVKIWIFVEQGQKFCRPNLLAATAVFTGDFL